MKIRELLAFKPSFLKPSFLKLSLLSLLCFTLVDTVLPINALAGDAPVALPESGSSSIGNRSFLTPRRQDESAANAQIRHSIASLLRTLQDRQIVESLRGKTLPISSNTIEVIAAASRHLSNDNVAVLEQQLRSELEGLAIDITVIETSPRNLSSSIASSNALIRSLNSQQLAAAIESPTFMTLLHMQSVARQALSDGRLLSDGDDDAMVLLQMSLP